MKGSMFDPSDAHPDTCPDTYLNIYLDTYPDTRHITPTMSLSSRARYDETYLET